jgi:hypothetical protein
VRRIFFARYVPIRIPSGKNKPYYQQQ